VIVRVKAAACNYNDIWARRGMPGLSVAFPHISGSDVAGEVVKAGSEVHSVKPGDEVVVHCGVSCRHCEACASGEDVFCREFRIWGFQTGPLDGGHSELVRIPAYNVLPKPKNLSWEEASSMPLVLVTAWRKLVTRAKVKPGDFVLVWGAAGGLGMMACRSPASRAGPSRRSLEEKLACQPGRGVSSTADAGRSDEVRITGRRGAESSSSILAGPPGRSASRLCGAGVP
jgi:D-arabinose 1-dehydrogenase-like Zn-dependent alcohol dehydrogenase